MLNFCTVCVLKDFIQSAVLALHLVSVFFTEALTLEDSLGRVGHR